MGQYAQFPIYTYVDRHPAIHIWFDIATTETIPKHLHMLINHNTSLLWLQVESFSCDVIWNKRRYEVTQCL